MNLCAGPFALHANLKIQSWAVLRKNKSSHPLFQGAQTLRKLQETEMLEHRFKSHKIDELGIDPPRSQSPICVRPHWFLNGPFTIRLLQTPKCKDVGNDIIFKVHVCVEYHFQPFNPGTSFSPSQDPSEKSTCLEAMSHTFDRPNENMG